MAFDMLRLSHFTFQSVPVLLLSGSAGWFVAHEPSDRGRRHPLHTQSPESCISFVDNQKCQSKSRISFIIYWDLASEPWFTSCDYQCKWSKAKTSMSLPRSNRLTKRPSVCICQLSTCWQKWPVPPTGMNVVGCLLFLNNCWELFG